MADSNTPIDQSITSPAVVAPAEIAPTVVTPAEVVTAPEIKQEVTPAPVVVAEPTSILGEKLPETKVIDIKTGEEKAPEVKPAEAVKPAEEIKPADAKPVEEVKAVEGEVKDEGKQSEEPAPLPTYELKLPDDVTLDDARLGEFTKELAEFETLTKAPHEEMQKLGQKLVDRYVAEVQNTIKGYQDAWVQRNNDWLKSFENDPEIGGNRKETTKTAALEFISTHGGTPEQQQEFRQLMDMTGAGNHPAMIRMFAKAMTSMKEGGPIPASKPAPDARSKVATRYGNKSN